MFTFYGKDNRREPLPGVAFTIVSRRSHAPGVVGGANRVNVDLKQRLAEFTRARSLISTGESVSTSIESASRCNASPPGDVAPFEFFIDRDAIALVSPAIGIYESPRGGHPGCIVNPETRLVVWSSTTAAYVDMVS